MTVILTYALCTVADVKEILSIDAGDTSKDNLITRKINQATEMIERYCDRRFKLSTYTQEVYNATGTDQIVLKNAPVTGDVTLQARTSPFDEDNWEDIDTQFHFVDANAGIVDLTYSTFGRWGGYRASYVGGYSTIPSDIAEACATLAAYLVQNPTSIGTAVKRKSEGQRSIEYFDSTGMSIVESLGLDDILALYVLNFVGSA